MNPVEARRPLKDIEVELTAEKFVRKTNKNNNDIYVFTHHDSPNLMHEIGRLRELTFRMANGGTGKSLDIDQYDTAEVPYKQLIVWDPEYKEILGGYRYYICKEAPKDTTGTVQIATTKLFRFTKKFETDYLPYSIELGRSFVKPDFQSTKLSRRSLFALDNLWDGLGALMVDNPEMKYFIGKVTMYPTLNQHIRDLMYHFIQIYFPFNESLAAPIQPLKVNNNDPEILKLFSGSNYKEDHKILSQSARELGENIPPLINTYMNISPNMQTFGTVENTDFGRIEDTGILLTIPDIYDSKKSRHVDTYKPAGNKY